MMKMIVTIVNAISAIPILVYPFLLIAGVMSFDAPGSGKSLSAWLIFLASVGYPLIIIAIIFFSQKYDSLSLALIALVPLLVLIYVFFFSGGTAQKNNFNTVKKDFVCDDSSFLSLGGDETHPIRGLELLEKRNFFTYKNYDIAEVYGNKWISAEKINTKDIVNRTNQLLTSCRNAKGKTPIQVYTKIESDQVKDILKQI